jgi:hypothetical protein
MMAQSVTIAKHDKRKRLVLPDDSRPDGRLTAAALSSN